MKILGIIGLSLGLGTASLAQADAPLNPTTLGSVDAVLTFCGQLNPAHASAYRAWRESIMGKESERAREAATHMTTYKDAFAQISNVLKTAPRDWAVRACSDLLPGPGPRPEHGHASSRQSVPHNPGDRHK